MRLWLSSSSHNTPRQLYDMTHHATPSPLQPQDFYSSGFTAPMPTELGQLSSPSQPSWYNPLLSNDSSPLRCTSYPLRHSHNKPRQLYDMTHHATPSPLQPQDFYSNSHGPTADRARPAPSHGRQLIWYIALFITFACIGQLSSSSFRLHATPAVMI